MVRELALASEDKSSTTFTPNQRLPIHRWFRYSAGFSGTWVGSEVRAFRESRGFMPRVFDPFAGCGTTLVAAQLAGSEAIGLEAHPFVFKVAQAKLDWRSPVSAFANLGERLLRSAASQATPRAADFPELFTRIFSPEALVSLQNVRRAMAEHLAHDTPESRLVWLAVVSALRACSYAGTAPWQYVLPNKRKARVSDAAAEIRSQIARMSEDMNQAQAACPYTTQAKVIAGDARSCTGVESNSVDLILTSPPYPNNYDYADATRLEMSFLGEVSSWAGLHEAVRRHLLRSCSQHTAKEKLDLNTVLAVDALSPIRNELTAVCEQLASLRQTRAGKKTYDTMIAAYFADMAGVWKQIARVLRPGGRACLVIGDSAPYGIHVAVEVLFGKLAESVGLAVDGFEETRQRNMKWKNRKHRVPLREGRLWVRKAIANG